MGMTVGQLKAAIAELPDDTKVVVETCCSPQIVKRVVVCDLQEILDVPWMRKTPMRTRTYYSNDEKPRVGKNERLANLRKPVLRIDTGHA